MPRRGGRKHGLSFGHLAIDDVSLGAYDKTAENMPQRRKKAKVVRARADSELQQAQEKIQEQKATPEEEYRPPRRLTHGITPTGNEAARSGLRDLFASHHLHPPRTGHLMIRPPRD